MPEQETATQPALAAVELALEALEDEYQQHHERIPQGIADARAGLEALRAVVEALPKVLTVAEHEIDDYDRSDEARHAALAQEWEHIREARAAWEAAR